MFANFRSNDFGTLCVAIARTGCAPPLLGQPSPPPPQPHPQPMSYLSP
jgi:hypothetical protein